MPVKNIYIITIASIITFNVSVSDAQHYIGFSGGYSVVSFTNFVKKERYDANYHLKNGISLSSFYETKMDSLCNLKIELQYKWQNADMKISSNSGHYSFYENSNYYFHLLGLNLICSFRLVEKKSFKLYFLFGPTFIYNINTSVRGGGWDYYYQTQIDTSGNPMQILTTRHYEKDERHSKDLSKFNVGVDLGLEFIIPVNVKMDFLIQNRYNIFVTSFIKQHNLRYTSLFSGYLNIGFRYKL